MSLATSEEPAAGRRRLLLVIPSFHNYEHRIVEAAEAAGYDCHRVDERIGNGFVEKALTRLGIAQRIKPLIERYLARLIATAREFDPDIVLVVNAETLTARSVARLRAALPRTRFLIYMWDSSSKKNVSEAMYAQFDRACSFDPLDCARIARLHHVPLFHLNRAPAWQDPGTAPEGPFEFDCSFIGTARVRRMTIMAGMARRLRRAGRPFHFYLYAPSRWHYLAFALLKRIVGYDGVLSRESVPYETYQAIIGRSAAGIDIEQSHQNGLTMRTLEVVFSGRPLITTNKWVSRYDFFAEFPISVYEPGGEIEIPAGEPSAAAAGLFDKYSLKNWLQTILEEREVDYMASERRHLQA